MAKKGANAGHGSTKQKNAKNAEMAKHLPPAPSTRPRGWSYPYHSNMGTNHQRPGQRKDS